MHHRLPLLSALVFACSAASALAGAPEKEIAPLAPRLSDPWEFSLGLPGWLAATSGSMGLNGHSADMYISADKLVRCIDMTASFAAEVRKGRLGFYTDFLYVSASDGQEVNGLVQKVDVRLDQYLIDMDLIYRVYQGPHGFVDLRAGVRYTNLYNRLTVQPDDEAINRQSTALVDEVGERVRDRVEQRLKELDLKNKLKTVLEEKIKGGIQDKLDPLKGERPSLPIAPIGGDRPGVIHDLVRGAVQSRLRDLAAAYEKRRDAATGRLRSEAQRRIDALKKEISKEVASKLHNALDTTGTLAEDWWDPYVGFRAQWNISKAFYLKATGDIGGFGIGSELTWQAAGVLGCNVTRSLFMEAGYRYLYTDYDNNGFTYRISQSGAQITAGILF